LVRRRPTVTTRAREQPTRATRTRRRWPDPCATACVLRRLRLRE
jgi:hypothetical protein